MSRLDEFAARLSPEDRAAMEAGNYCKTERTPRKSRAPKPALPHEYRSCRITAAEGTWVVCAIRNCQDEQHATMAKLGILR